MNDAIATVIALAITFVLMCGCGHNVNYVMPNGIHCTVLDTTTGVNKFTGCSDGQTYVNPPTYSTVSG